ncbi:hypothetical protein EON65_56820 [archaeon]|nr:MAG: hypothetical protein EON65_56820 [archaeon]
MVWLILIMLALIRNHCSRRGKLFLFGETLLDKGTGNKTWKERGVGEVKFLKHKESGRIRVLMRQEKTMKVIINHFLDPRIVLSPNVGSDKSWVWVAFDFSEGELVETVSGLVVLQSNCFSSLFSFHKERSTLACIFFSNSYD